MLEIIWKTALTLLIAFLGGELLKKLKVPMGEILGSVSAVILLQLTTPIAFFPSQCKMLVQFVLGAIVASRIGREDLLGIKKMAMPFLLLIIGLSVYTLICATMIFKLSDMNIPTSLLCSAPGGMSDITIISQDFGASSDYVSSIHVLRAITILVFSPALYRGVQKFGKSRYAPAFIVRSLNGYGKGDKRIQKTNAPIPSNAKMAAIGTIAVAAIGGSLFKGFGIPAGAMIGSIIAVIIMNLTVGVSYIPQKLNSFSRIGVGCYIGVMIKRDFIANIHTIIIPAVLVLSGIFITTIIMALIISRVFKYDLITSMLMCIPGGITEISVIADEFNVDKTKLICMQSLRLIAVVTLFPNYIYLLEKIFL